MSTKPKVIKDYEKLADDLIEQIKLTYPKGFRRNLISFIDMDGKKKKGLPFETDDRYYLIRMTEQRATDIIADDDDYDTDGNLKKKVQKVYEDKHLDEDEDDDEDDDFLEDLEEAEVNEVDDDASEDDD